MKKIWISFLAMFLLITLACCNKKVERIQLNGQMDISETIDLSHDELALKLASKEASGTESAGDDFLLYVYANGCISCSAFSTNVLKPFIAETSAVIYSIETTRVQDLFSTPMKYSSNPRLVIFKDGKVLAQTNMTSNATVFNSKDGLSTYLQEYVIMPTLIEVNYLQLLPKLANEEKLIVYYGWKSCGDCSYLESHYLKEFLASNAEGPKWFYFEVSQFRQYKTESGNGENENIWNDFTKLTQIDINNNRGKIPTIAYYESGVLKDYVVYFNDKLEYDESSKTYKVTMTSYGDTTDNPIVGKTFSNYLDYQKGVESYHTQKFVDFMDKHYTD